MHAKANTPPISDTDMLARYERAQTLFRGMNSTQVVRNGTVFPVWIGETNRFWYGRELLLDGKVDKPGKEFRLVDAESASNEPAFDHKVLAGLLSEEAEESIDPHNLPISDVRIELDPLAVHFKAFDQSWCYQEASQSLEPTTSYPKAWVISPDGSQAVFVRDFNLWLRDLQSGEEQALTSDGEEF